MSQINKATARGEILGYTFKVPTEIITSIGTVAIGTYIDSTPGTLYECKAVHPKSTIITTSEGTFTVKSFTFHSNGKLASCQTKDYLLHTWNNDGKYVGSKSLGAP